MSAEHPTNWVELHDHHKDDEHHEPQSQASQDSGAQPNENQPPAKLHVNVEEDDHASTPRSHTESVHSDSSEHTIDPSSLDESLLMKLPFAEYRNSMPFTLVLLFIISLGFWVTATNRLEHTEEGHIPLFLTLSWYLIGSWILGRFFITLRAPPVLGYLISGFALQYFLDPTWAKAKPTVTLLAFLIVLCRAGLEISPQDLSTTSVSLGIFPILAEAFTIGGFCMYYLNFAAVEAFLLGFVMSPVGDGLVIPKMQEFKPMRLGPMPRVMFTALPLEVITALFLFGIFQGFAHPGDQPLSMLIILGVFVKFFGTILFTLFAAFVFSQLAYNRENFKILNKKVFTGTDKEELLFLLAAVLMSYSLCSDEPTVIPNGYGEIAIFQSDMAAILVSLFYAQFRPLSMHAIEDSLAAIWMFGALFLFTSLGSNIKISSFIVGFKYFPVLLLGLLARLVCLFVIAKWMPLEPDRAVFLRDEKHSRKLPYEVLFAWVSSFPRATLQGALSRIPGIMMLFSDSVNTQILHAGVFVLAVMAPIGSIILDFAGLRLLHKIKAIDDEITASGQDAGATPVVIDASIGTDKDIQRPRSSMSAMSPDAEWRHRDRAATKVVTKIKEMVRNQRRRTTKMLSTPLSRNFMHHPQLNNPELAPSDSMAQFHFVPSHHHARQVRDTHHIARVNTGTASHRARSSSHAPHAHQLQPRHGHEEHGHVSHPPLARIDSDRSDSVVSVNSDVHIVQANTRYPEAMNHMEVAEADVDERIVKFMRSHSLLM